MLGTGYALPGEPVTTEQLLACIERNFGVDVRATGTAVARKLGVASRHLCRDLLQRHERPRLGENNAALAARAVEQALQDAGVGVADLSYLIGHTCSPGQALPPNIAAVADLLGYGGPYFELRQACTGFANALIAARGLLAAPHCGPVAIVGSETGSVYFDPVRAAEDHGQLVNLLQMGDAAGACVIGRDVHGGAGTLSHVYFGQQGAARRPGFSLECGGSDVASNERTRLEFFHHYADVRASGPELFELGLAAARSMGVDSGQLDGVIPHQVSGRIAGQLAPYLGFSTDQLFVNADRCGNTGSAAIWLALAQLRPQLRTGNRVLVLGAEASKYMYGGFLYVHG